VLFAFVPQDEQASDAALYRLDLGAASWSTHKNDCQQEFCKKGGQFYNSFRQARFYAGNKEDVHDQEG